ncbi:MAG: lipase family protein [Pseudonocardia sp.]
MLLAALGTATAGTAAAAPEPGSLVRAQPTTVFAAPLVREPGVRAWSLTYRSTSATGAPNEVSGTLLVPVAAWTGEGPRPLVSYAIGTHGLGDQCAPSAFLAAGREQELGLMRMALRRGWAVVVPDYEGLGTPGDHTYAMAVTEGHAVLDAARAAVRVDGAGIAPDAPVGLWGYSQGGGATAKAAEQAATYAPELDVRGAAPGGVPADLVAVAEHLDGGPAAGLLVAATGGLDTAYPELGLFEQLNARGKALVTAVRTQCVEQIVLTGAGARSEDLSTVPDPLHQPAVVERLTENGAGTVAPAFPVRVYHAQADELIPVAVGRALVADWCALDVTVEYEELPLQTHVGGAAAGAPGTVDWLADRFAGRDAPSTC